MGKHTAEFGKWLQDYLKEEQPSYSVYYDHGDRELGNVGEIQGFVGEVTNSGNILAQADVMVVDEDMNIKLLIEIEEKASLSPKALLGVIFSICSSVAGDEVSLTD